MRLKRSAQGAADAPAAKKSTGHTDAAPDVPVCLHGKMELRVCKNGQHAGKSYLCCSLPRNHPQRCENAFIWLADTPSGKQLAAASCATAGSAEGGRARDSGAADGSTTSATSVTGVRAVRSAPLERAVVAAGPARSLTSALSMRERLLASNRRAGERQPVDKDGYEVAQILTSMKRMKAHQAARGV